MAPHRGNRVGEEIKKELAEIIRDEMKDPELKGLISVTHVEVSRDIRYAVIYVSCLGGEAEQARVLKAFKKAAGFIRTALAGRLNLRFTPELTFKADQSIRVGARINQLLAAEATGAAVAAPAAETGAAEAEAEGTAATAEEAVPAAAPAAETAAATAVAAAGDQPPDEV
jgi:ribosome-binding factor A